MSIKTRLVVMCGAAALVMAAAGYAVFRHQFEVLRSEKYLNLQAIADLKVAQLARWRQERLADARLHAEGPLLRTAIGQWLGARADAARGTDLQDRLRLIRSVKGYEEVALLDATGAVLLASGQAQPDALFAAAGLAARAAATNVPLFGDLFACPACARIHLDLAAPIRDPAGRTLAVLLLRSDPDTYLFPLLQSWPLPSASGETVLTRTDGRHALFLNRLRHAARPPLTLRVPLSQTDLPTARAARGFLGRFEGRDYRGVPVVAEIRKVPGSSWFLIAKMDTAELLAEARSRGVLIGLLVLLGILAASLVAALVYRQKEHQLTQALLDAAEVRRQAQEEIRATLYGIGDGVIAVDAAGRVTRLNAAAETLTGWSEEEAHGKPLADVFRLVNEFTRQPVDSPAAGILREGRPAALDNHLLLVARDGSERPIADSGAPIRDPAGRPVGVVLVFRDQTRERAARQAIEASERDLKQLIQSMLNAFVLFESVFDHAGRFVSYRFLMINGAYERITGVTQEGVRGKTVHEVWPGTEPSWIEAYGRVAVSGVPAVFEMYHAPTGKHYHCHVYRPGPGPDRFCVIFEDITARKRAEQQLRQLSAAVEQSPALVVITDVRGAIDYVNPKFTAVTGYTLDEVRGRTPRLLKSGETPPEEYRRLWAAITAGGEWRGEFHNKKKDGTLYWERAAISPIRDAAGTITHFVAVKEDITAQKRIEDQLLQARKMESVGRLAGGVAHDFNNMLQAILGNCEMAIESLSPEHPLYTDLQEIRKAAQRSAALTRQLLAFARKQPVKPVLLDLNTAVASILPMLRRLIPENVELAWSPVPGLGAVVIDPVQFDQLLTNLVSNAGDAVEGQGRVTIDAANADVAPGDPELAPGAYVRLTVRDTGRGMNAETLARVFEPFFTTKAVGRGTGLGLATVYGIVKQNGGHVTAASAPDRGSIFAVFLPRRDGAPADTPAPAQPLESAPAPQPAGSRGTILFVEDEPAILKIGRRQLEQLGYTVLAADTPIEALRLAAAHAGPLALLVTDVVMPGMNGQELAARLAERQPGLKCLFLSGHTADVIARKAGVLEDGIFFLQKPFTGRALADKVRRVIAAP